MWQFGIAKPRAVHDTERFLAYVNQRQSFFDYSKPVFAGRAPGRLDLMGGIADYSGSLVLALPIAQATWVAVQSIPEPYLEISSFSDTTTRTHRLSLVELLGKKSYEEVQTWLGLEPAQAWVAYPAGVWLLLLEKFGLNNPAGLRMLIYSEVPGGKGVSSSAALEVATLQALLGLYKLEMSGLEMAQLCQKAENHIVGAPCGITDQLVVTCGENEQLSAIRCQPASLLPSLKLPADLNVWGIDSGIQHAVSGADYTDVRVAAFMGYRMIAQFTDLPMQYLPEKATGQVVINDARWEGYLANLTPAEWETDYAHKIPEKLGGQEFLNHWQGITDTITKVEPAKTYAVRQATAHPIYENQRVRLFYALLQLAATHKNNTETFQLLGELMYQSNVSYSRCGLGSSGTDRLVELARLAGLKQGIYGAKITGGGSGGTVAILGNSKSQTVVEEIANHYAKETGYNPLLISNSSPGALAFDKLTLGWVETSY